MQWEWRDINKEVLLSRRSSCCQGGSPGKEDGIGRRRERRIEGERDRSAVGVMWKEINKDVLLSRRVSCCQGGSFFADP